MIYKLTSCFPNIPRAFIKPVNPYKIRYCLSHFYWTILSKGEGRNQLNPMRTHEKTQTPGVSPYSLRTVFGIFNVLQSLSTLKGCETLLGSNHLQMTLQRQHLLLNNFKSVGPTKVLNPRSLALKSDAQPTKPPVVGHVSSISIIIITYSRFRCITEMKILELGWRNIERWPSRLPGSTLFMNWNCKFSAPLRETFTPFILNQYLLCLICFKVNGSRPKEELELVRILEKMDYHNYVSFISSCYTKNSQSLT